jgi:hypothetical protein
MGESEHLGDGAYVTVGRDFGGQIIFTANHHEEDKATDAIHMDYRSVATLVRFLRSKGFKFGGDE